MEINELITDTEIQSAMPHLSDEEFQQLEQNILNDGKVTDPIIVWGNKIVDGEHRVRILREHPEIPFSIEYMDFPDEDAAIAWACFHQAGRRNLTRQNLNIIVGTASICAKRSNGASDGFRGNQYTKVKSGESGSGPNWPTTKNSDDKHITRNETAEAFGVSEGRVRHAEDITKAVDLADEAVPGFKEEYKSGNIKMSDDFIKKAMKVPEEDRAEVAEAIMDVNKDNTDEENKENKKWAQALVEQYSDFDDCADDGNSDEFETEDEGENAPVLLSSEESGYDIRAELGLPPEENKITVENLSSAISYHLDVLDNTFEVLFKKYEEVFCNSENRNIIAKELSRLNGLKEKYLELADEYGQQ